MSDWSCGKRVFRKPQFTGFPVMGRDCSLDAKYRTPEGQRCTKHTAPELRTKENRIKTPGMCGKDGCFAQSYSGPLLPADSRFCYAHTPKTYLSQNMMDWRKFA